MTYNGEHTGRPYDGEPVLRKAYLDGTKDAAQSLMDNLVEGGCTDDGWNGGDVVAIVDEWLQRHGVNTTVKGNPRYMSQRERLTADLRALARAIPDEKATAELGYAQDRLYEFIEHHASEEKEGV